MTLYLSAIFSLLTTLACAQTDSTLIRKLDSMSTADQKSRHLMVRIINKETDTLSKDAAQKQLSLTDSLNYIQIKKIFNQSGFPGYDKAGSQGTHNFWLLVQHADAHPGFLDSVLRKMKVEADKGNASLLDYAYLVDRVKVNTGQLQVYGTQMIVNAAKTSYEPKPTVEPAKLNERRKSVGLPTIEEYTKVMNEHYYGDLQKK